MLTKDQVIEKARKLFRLSTNDGATEHERERAMAQGHKLLAKYNLDMAALDLKPEDTLAGHDYEQREFYMSPFTRTIAGAIARLYFCDYLYIRGTNQHMFIGEKANAFTAAEMAEYVVNSLLREGNARFFIPEDRTSFFYGAADGIRTKAAELIEAARNMRQPGTALVLADAYTKQAELNNQFIAKFFGPTKKSRSRAPRYLNRAGVDAGRAYANGVNLTTNVTD
jgi:hypothetical protein